MLCVGPILTPLYIGNGTSQAKSVLAYIIFNTTCFLENFMKNIKKKIIKIGGKLYDPHAKQKTLYLAHMGLFFLLWISDRKKTKETF